MSYFNRQQGYSLVELLVVVALTALLATGAVNVFVSTLRGGGKAVSISKVKGDGDFAITTMERLIRGGKNLPQAQCASTTTPGLVTDLIVDELNGTQRRYFSQLVAGVNRIAIDDDVVNPSNPIRYLTSSEVNLNPAQISFQCLSGGGFAGDKVTIDFTLQDRNNSSYSEQFTSTVTLRNF